MLIWTLRDSRGSDFKNSLRAFIFFFVLISAISSLVELAAVVFPLVMCYLRKSRTETDPSDADAPTLSPLEFQHISNIPPDPR